MPAVGWPGHERTIVNADRPYPVCDHRITVRGETEMGLRSVLSADVGSLVQPLGRTS